MCRFTKRSAKYDALTLANGIIIGCVAVSGVVNNLDNWGAVLIGSISAVFYVGGVLFLNFWNIDDPLEVFPVHFLGGVWGLFATGFFDQTRGALYYGANQQGAFMGFHIVGIVVIVAFTSLVAAPSFLILRKLHLLRVSKAIEEIGLDVAELSGKVPEAFLDAVEEQIEKQEKAQQKAFEVTRQEW